MMICLATRVTHGWWSKAFCIQKVLNLLDSFPNFISILWYGRSNWGEPALCLQIWDLPIGQQKGAKLYQLILTLMKINMFSHLWKTQFSYDSSNFIILPTSVLFSDLPQWPHISRIISSSITKVLLYFIHPSSDLIQYFITFIIQSLFQLYMIPRRRGEKG